MRCVLDFEVGHVSFVASPTAPIPESGSFDNFCHDTNVSILCEGIGWQVSHIAQTLNQISAVLFNMGHFAIVSDSINSEPEDMDDLDWLELLRPFSSVQTLFVSKELAWHISCALNSAMVTELLPALDMLCLEDQPVSYAHKFIAARSEFGRPVTTVDTRMEFQERPVSYLN
jgi:hypothetical protein